MLPPLHAEHSLLLTVWKHSEREREREENGGEKEGYGEVQKEE